MRLLRESKRALQKAKGAWALPEGSLRSQFFQPPLVSRLPFRSASTTTSQRLVISGTTTPRQPLLRAQLNLPPAPAGPGSHQRSLYGLRLSSGAHRSHTAVLRPGRDGAGHPLGPSESSTAPAGGAAGGVPRCALGLTKRAQRGLQASSAVLNLPQLRRG